MSDVGLFAHVSVHRPPSVGSFKKRGGSEVIIQLENAPEPLAADSLFKTARQQALSIEERIPTLIAGRLDWM